MRTVELWNNKETVRSDILRIFWTGTYWTGVGGEEERQCWVCFASEEDDPVAAWVHPCLCKGTTKWVHQVWPQNQKEQFESYAVGVYPTLGGWKAEREQQHWCRVSSMWRRLYHTGRHSHIESLKLTWFSLSFLPLRHFFDFWMPWTSWWVSVVPANSKLVARWADCAPLLPVECAWDRSTGLVSHMGPSPSCRYEKVFIGQRGSPRYLEGQFL